MSSSNVRQLVLYSKPGCHLCEGLQEKLESIQKADPCPLEFTLEIRDITTQSEWFEAYQYEIPVLFWTRPAPESTLVPISRPSPRASVANVLKLLQASC